MEMLDQLNWMDLALALVLLVILMIGFSLGLYRQVALMMGAIVGVFVAARFTPDIIHLEFLERATVQLGEGGVRVGVYLTLAALPVALAFVSFLAFPKVFGRALRLVDSLLGGAVGLAWATFLIWFFLLGSAAGQKPWLVDSVESSYLAPRLVASGEFMARLLPEGFRARVKNRLNEQFDSLREAPPQPERDRRG